MYSHRENLITVADILRQLKGQRCWECAAAPVTGTTLSLNFGTKLSWAPIGNRENIEDYFGEFGIMLEGAAWRILNRDTAIMTSDAKMTEQRASDLAVFCGKLVLEASVDVFTLDLTILFEGELRLDVFCNCFDESLDNYTISHEHSYYSIRARERRLSVFEEKEE
jgi:hypothetical protein